MLSSCKEESNSILFPESQPKNIEALASFPKSLQGMYYCKEDNSELKITSNLLIQKYTNDFKVEELGDDVEFSGDTLIDKKTGERLFLKRLNDSIIEKIISFDTIFRISDDQIVKKMNGNYILNSYRESGEGWVISILNKKNENLYLSFMDSLAESSIAKITKQKVDTIIPRYYNPSKAQFRKFLKSDAHQYKKEFIRVEYVW